MKTIILLFSTLFLAACESYKTCDLSDPNTCKSTYQSDIDIQYWDNIIMNPQLSKIE